MRKSLKMALSILLAASFLFPAYAAQAREETQTPRGGVFAEKLSLTYPSESSGLQRSVFLPSTYRSASLPSVRDQGPNGLCWAFAALTGIEASLIKNGTAQNPVLSVLHMAYATSDRNGNASHGFDRIPEDGGHRGMASAYLMRGQLQGAVDEKQDPYGNYTYDFIPNNRALSVTRDKKPSYTVENALFFGGYSKSDVSNDKIKEAIMTYGTVPCSMWWDGSAVSHNSGSTYYNETHSAYFYDGRKRDYDGDLDVNHSVTLVGWDDSFPRDRFNASHRPSGNGAWLALNSWGNEWGDRGYFWISYEDTNNPLYPWAIDGVKPYDPDAKIYEYDPHGCSDTLFYDDETTIFGANVFTVGSGGEVLNEVKLFVPTDNTNIRVYVVPNYTGTASLSTRGTPVIRKSVTWPGWYTLALDSAVALGGAGSQFAVIVEYTVQRWEAEAPISDPYWGGWSTSTVTRNVSYITYTGRSSWEPLSDCNLNIKAVTGPATAAPPPPPPPSAAAGLDNFVKIQSYDNRFTDLNWSRDWVSKAYEYGIIAGTSSTTYGSNDNMTIQNALVIASKMHGIYHTGDFDYDTYGAYPTGYIIYALEHNIIDNRFAGRYTDNATRAELAYMWSRILPRSELQGINTYNPVSDVSANHEHYDAIKLFYEAGIVSGSDTGLFNPDSPASRGDCAVMFVRLVSPSDRSKYVPPVIPDEPDDEPDEPEDEPGDYTMEDAAAIFYDYTIAALNGGYLEELFATLNLGPEYRFVMNLVIEGVEDVFANVDLKMFTGIFVDSFSDWDADDLIALFSDAKLRKDLIDVFFLTIINSVIEELLELYS